MKGYSWNKAYKTAIIKKFHLQFDRDISLLEDQIFNVKYISVAERSLLYSASLLPLLAKKRKYYSST